MIGVHEQLGPVPLTRLERRPEIRHDVRIGIEHGGDQDCGGMFIDLLGEPFSQGCSRPARNLHNLDTLLTQPVQLPPNGVKLTICCDQLVTLL